MSLRALDSVDSVSELRDLQVVMADAIMRPLTDNYDIREQWNATVSTESVVSQFIRPNNRLTSLERLEIYNRQYWFRLLDCLYEDFPGLRAVLGEQTFSKLAQAYLTRNPSRSFTLRNLGDRLEAFLRAEPNWTKPNQALALDMARFEWAQVVAFDEESRPPMGLDDLLGCDPSNLRLFLQPHLTLLELGYELDDFSIALKRQVAGTSSASNAVAKPRLSSAKQGMRKPKRGRIYVVVHRFDNALYYKRLEPKAFSLLSLLRGRVTLSEACNRVLSKQPGKAETRSIGEWFQTWAQLGWFCADPASLAGDLGRRILPSSSLTSYD